MELAQLEALVEAARRGSLRRAAEALFLAQPSLTGRVRKLERELGKPLFYRTSRGVVLTEAGKAFLPFAENILVSVREGTDAVLAARPRSGGELRVGATVVAMYVLSETFQEFRRRHSTDLIIRSARSEEILQMVLRDEVDVGVGRPLSHPKTQTFLVCDEQVVLVTPRDHPLVRQEQVRMVDLAGETLIRYTSQRTPLLARAERASGAADPPLNVRIIVDDIEVAKHMIGKGLGVAFMPLVAVRREVEQGLFSTVRVVDSESLAGRIALLVPRKQPWGAHVRSFLELLQERFGQGAIPLPLEESLP